MIYEQGDSVVIRLPSLKDLHPDTYINIDAIHCPGRYVTGQLRARMKDQCVPVRPYSTWRIKITHSIYADYPNGKYTHFEENKFRKWVPGLDEEPPPTRLFKAPWLP